jgi:hypothetical protein
MPQTRWDYVKRKTAESGQTGTITYDLPERGFMPELLLTAFSTPTATTAPACPLSDAITKIEIIDGGLVLKSLTGNQVKGLSMIHGHNPLLGLETNDNGVEGYDHFFIPMGGVFNGERYAPDMSQFNNPQIRITWDYSITTTEFGMTVTADSSPAMKFSVLAEMCKTAGVYRHGYTKSSIIKEFTQATSTTNIIDIPTGDQLVGLAVEAGYDALDFTEDVENIKLDIDNGDWIPFHLYEEEVLQSQQLWFKHPFQYSWRADLESAEELDTHMGHLSHLGAMGSEYDNLIISYDSASKGVETITIVDAGDDPTATDVLQQIYLKAIGWCPFHVWYVPARVLTGYEKDTLDTSLYGRIELESTSGSSASTSSTPDIIAEYLRI